MNDENLIRFNQMQPERHKELSRLGGIASRVGRVPALAAKREKTESERRETRA